MDISPEALDQLIPKDYFKPDIAVGNYYLKWDEQSYGIPQKEVLELKRFVADVAPFLTALLYEAIGGAYRVVEEKAGAKEARRIEEVFSPQILITRKRGGFAYDLQMKRDGTTVISRSEMTDKKTALALSWKLGELLFNRQRHA